MTQIHLTSSSIADVPGKVRCPTCGGLGWSISGDQEARDDFVVWALTEAGKRGLKFADDATIPLTASLANKIAIALAGKEKQT